MIKNAVLNVIGFGFPLLVGVLVFPLLTQEMGGERFGLLTLIWTMVGYFNLFDFGVSRALTRLVSIELSRRDRNLTIAGSGLLFLLSLGVFAGLLVFLAGGRLLTLLYSSDSRFFEEAAGAVNWIALSLPFVLISSGCVGILESLGRFLALNLTRAALGVSTFVVPLVVFRITQSLEWVALGLLAVRFVYCLIVLWLALNPILRFKIIGFSVSHIKNLFSFGAWLTLSNIVGPIMLYGDRFLVASISGVTLSGYYGITNEILTKILILPSAIMGAAFPVFSTYAIDKKASVKAFWRALRFTVVTVLFVLFVVSFLGPGIASNWMGRSFSDVFIEVLPFILSGILFNSIGLVLQGFIQAANRPDLTAKLHVLELCVYLPYAYYLIQEYSVIGAAIAWAIRTLVSMVSLCYLAFKIMKEVN